MKKKIIAWISICIMFSLGQSLVITAKNGEYEENTSIDNNYSEKIQAQGQQLEDFNPPSSNLREMYGGYKRNGVYKILKSDGSVLNATGIWVKWESQGDSSTTKYYLVNGKYVKINSKDIAREINTYEEQLFELKKDLNIVYSEPFDNCKINNKKVKKGIYKTIRSSIDFVEIKLSDGTKVWINPQYTPNFVSTSNGQFSNTKASLNVTNVNGIPIYIKMMPVREEKRTGIAMKPSYVTIHNTANSAKGADALSHANYQINDNNEYVSWHFTVDDKSVYQSMPMNEVGWHAGDGLSNGNGSSIGIEICENEDGNYAKAERNAALLVAQILYENNLPPTAVKRHADWSGKNCPHNMEEMSKGSMGWVKFLQLVEGEYNNIVSRNEENVIKIFSFVGKENANDAKTILENQTGLSSTIYKTGDTDKKFSILTGGFIGRDNAEQSRYTLIDKFNVDSDLVYSGKTEGIKKHIFKIKTGGFIGIESVQNALESLINATGWWATYEEIPNQPNVYRIVTGGFVGEDKINRANEFVKESFGWWTEFIDTNEVVNINQEDIYKLRLKSRNSYNDVLNLLESIKYQTGWYLEIINDNIDFYGLKTQKLTNSQASYWSNRITKELQWYNEIEKKEI